MIKDMRTPDECGYGPMVAWCPLHAALQQSLTLPSLSINPSQTRADLDPRSLLVSRSVHAFIWEA